MEAHPAWIKVKPFDRTDYKSTYDLIQEHRLNTVCLEANCPNRYECFARGTATFMILGDTCTRACRYCNVKSGIPGKVDEDEPRRIGEAVKKMGLRHAVITCVTRDDLADGGASHFVDVVKEIRRCSPNTSVELLISDLDGNIEALKTIVDAKPEVLNHNIETVERLFPKMRPKGSYLLSLGLLKSIKTLHPGVSTKASIIVGMGETHEEIIETMKDLRGAKVDILTIGQYLQPSPKHAPVDRYVTPEEFNQLKEIGQRLQFKHVIAGPMVRSSYRAESCVPR